MNDIFAHTISRADLVGGMVRLELVTLQPGQANAAPTPEAKNAVFMPLDGFLTSMNTMEGLVKQMVDAGVLKRNEPAKG